MPRVKALRDQFYKTRRLLAGDEVEMSERDARIHLALKGRRQRFGRADEAPAPEPPLAAPPVRETKQEVLAKPAPLPLSETPKTTSREKPKADRPPPKARAAAKPGSEPKP